MQVTAKLNNLRIAPRKVRLAANLIKGMDVNQARNQLRFLVKKSSESILKLLNSAAANAKNNFNLEENNLYVDKILVDEGPTLKRWLPRAFGRATPIMKRTSHITLILAERKPTEVRKDAKKKEVKEKAVTPEEFLKKGTEEKLPAEEKKPARRIKESGRPPGASTVSKKRYFSRQGIKRMFQRKSV